MRTHLIFELMFFGKQGREDKENTLSICLLVTVRVQMKSHEFFVIIVHVFDETMVTKQKGIKDTTVRSTTIIKL